MVPLTLQRDIRPNLLLCNDTVSPETITALTTYIASHPLPHLMEALPVILLLPVSTERFFTSKIPSLLEHLQSNSSISSWIT